MLPQEQADKNKHPSSIPTDKNTRNIKTRNGTDLDASRGTQQQNRERFAMHAGTERKTTERFMDRKGTERKWPYLNTIGLLEAND